MHDGVSPHLQQALQRITDIQDRLQRFETPEAPPAGTFQEMVQASTLPETATRRGRIPADVQAIIARAAARYQLRPALLQAVVEAESGGNPRAVSPKGAIGLMQLMPGTAAALGVSDPYDPEANIMGGAQYLRQQLDRFNGDEAQAVAAYNAGPGAVLRHHGIPPYAETQTYVARVLSLANRDE